MAAVELQMRAISAIPYLFPIAISHPSLPSSNKTLPLLCSALPPILARNAHWHHCDRLQNHHANYQAEFTPKELVVVSTSQTLGAHTSRNRPVRGRDRLVVVLLVLTSFLLKATVGRESLANSFPCSSVQRRRDKCRRNNRSRQDIPRALGPDWSCRHFADRRW